MTKILITGATGNVGMEVLKSLQKIDHQFELYAGLRNVEADQVKFQDYKIKFLRFDFADISSYDQALDNCSILFLLRPPQLADVEKYFRPIIDKSKEKGVKHIVFLSVQGVEKSKIIPHHKIEKLIVESGINYTFLRPAYFMQNFSTTLRHDLVHNKRIYLPAGKAKFTMIDVRDIGAVASSILSNTSSHINKSYELTSKEKLTFSEMAKILTEILGTEIRFTSPNLISFLLAKRKENMPTMMILVMIMLHYFPRFQDEPEITDWVSEITGKEAIRFEQFVRDYKEVLTD